MKENARVNFPAILAECKGIVTDACQKAGIARCTYYDWYNNDPDFKKDCDDVAEQVIDFVEGNLLKNINAGKEASAIFYLKTKAKHRGYVESIEHTGAGGRALIPDMSEEMAARRLIFGMMLEEQRRLESADTASDDFTAEVVETKEEK